MTDQKELKFLQDKARRAGRICTFYFDANGHLDGVFYLDPKGPGRQKTGLILDPLGFAEREREKPNWWEPPVTRKQTYSYSNTRTSTATP